MEGTVYFRTQREENYYTNIYKLLDITDVMEEYIEVLTDYVGVLTDKITKLEHKQNLQNEEKSIIIIINKYESEQ